MRFTRRELAAVLAPAAAAVAQTNTPASPADELKAAQARFKTAGETLARQELPMSTEPAFQFKV